MSPIPEPEAWTRLNDAPPPCFGRRHQGPVAQRSEVPRNTANHDPKRQHLIILGLRIIGLLDPPERWPAEPKEVLVDAEDTLEALGPRSGAVLVAQSRSVPATPAERAVRATYGLQVLGNSSSSMLVVGLAGSPTAATSQIVATLVITL